MGAKGRRKRRKLHDSDQQPIAEADRLPFGSKRFWMGVGVAGLLAIHFALAATSIRNKCCTFDEVAHLTRGYSFWKHDDARLISHHPPLALAWATLPLLNDDFKFPDRNQQAWYESDVYKLGRQFFYRLGNDPDVMLREARLMITLVSLALGVVVFYWSRRLFGTSGAFVSLGLYTFSPTILAHARLATTDIATSLFFFLSVTGIWWLLYRIHVGSVLASTAAVVALFLTKMSAVLLIPMGLILMIVRLVGGRPLHLKFGRERQITARWQMVPIFLGVMALYVVVVWSALWAAYGFRYEAMIGAQPGRDRFFAPPPVPEGKTVWEHQGRSIPQVAAGVDWMREHRVLPEAYLYMVLFTRQFMRGHDAFLDGQRRKTGWWYFFPMCFLYKVSLPVMGVIVMAAAAFVWGRARPPDSQELNKGARLQGRLHGFYRTAPLWALLAVYWGMAIGANLNIGHRHLTPTFAPMFVLCGASACWFKASRKWLRAVVPTLLGLLAVVSLKTWPDNLAFFNLIAGGPSNGYRHLVDSSLDWGQDLPRLSRWIDRNRSNQKIYVAYFGTGDWRHYGIKAYPLPYYLRSSGTGTYKLHPGIYCISATRLQQIYMLKTSHWTENLEKSYQRLGPEMREFEETDNTKEARSALLSRKDEGFKKRFDTFQKLRFGRLCAYLRGREPGDHVGHSILIYRLTEEDLQRALYSPVPFRSEPQPRS